MWPPCLQTENTNCFPLLAETFISGIFRQMIYPPECHSQGGKSEDWNTYGSLVANAWEEKKKKKKKTFTLQVAPRFNHQALITTVSTVKCPLQGVYFFYFLSFCILYPILCPMHLDYRMRSFRPWCVFTYDNNNKTSNYKNTNNIICDS